MKREESPEETLARLGVRVLPPPPNGAHYGKVNRRNGGSHPQPTTTFASPSKQPNVELISAEAIDPARLTGCGMVGSRKESFSFSPGSLARGRRRSPTRSRR